MLARHYRSCDAQSLDVVLGGNQQGDVRLDRDRIIVCGTPVNSCLVWRAGGIVHELRTGNGMYKRIHADALVNFAIADSIAKSFELHEALFLTDSDELSRYVLSLGAIEETGKRIFTLQVR